MENECGCGFQTNDDIAFDEHLKRHEEKGDFPPDSPINNNEQDEDKQVDNKVKVKVYVVINKLGNYAANGWPTLNKDAEENLKSIVMDNLDEGPQFKGYWLEVELEKPRVEIITIDQGIEVKEDKEDDGD